MPRLNRRACLLTSASETAPVAAHVGCLMDQTDVVDVRPALIYCACGALAARLWTVARASGRLGVVLDARALATAQ